MGAVLPFVPYLVVLAAVVALWVALLRRFRSRDGGRPSEEERQS